MRTRLGILFFNVVIGHLASSEVCGLLGNGRTVRFAVPANRHPCFLISVTAGRPIQVVVDQPQDIEIHSYHEGIETVTDSFQFGPETLTLSDVGAYRVEIRTVTGSPPIAYTFIMLRTVPALHSSDDWARAEILATLSKRTE